MTAILIYCALAVDLIAAGAAALGLGKQRDAYQLGLLLLALAQAAVCSLVAAAGAGPAVAVAVSVAALLQLGVTVAGQRLLDRHHLLTRRTEILREQLDAAHEEVSSQIEASEVRLGDVARAAPIVIFETDQRGRFTYLGDHWATLTGRDSADFLGREWWLGLDADGLQGAREKWTRANATKTLCEAELRIPRAGLEPVWVLCHSVPSSLRPDDRVGTMTDITERKRREAQTRRLERRVQQIEKLESLAVLAGGVAHDFNNLLVAVLGNAEILETMLPGESEPLGLISEIRTAALKAADLARNMLVYTGRGLPTTQRVDLSAQLERERRILAPTHGHIPVRFELASDLPPIEADPTQISQIVLNLVRNATEAMEGRPGEIVVRTGTREADRRLLASAYLDEDLPEGRYVFVEVTDQGPGMDPEILDRVFDPFFSTKFTGRGLGLAVVLGSVRSHRGAVMIDNRPGHGTTFFVMFPAQPKARQQLAVDTPSVDGWRGDGKVLVVDDEAPVRSVLRTLLRSRGFDVLEARGGRDAIESYRGQANDISAIVLDLAMPDMNGMEVARAIREIREDVPILLVSGFSEQEAIALFDGSKPQAFVQKPFETKVFLSRLRALLEE